jgi:hypothetical protein
MNVFPPAGTLNSRVIVSPAHLKQMIVALTENFKKYESQFGSVEASEPPAGQIGFQG